MTDTHTQKIIDGLVSLKHQAVTPKVGDRIIQLAIHALEATQWVPIDEIPEEWKDGRIVDFITADHNRYVGLHYDNNVKSWAIGESSRQIFMGTRNITHARLPPQLPEGE